MENEVEDGRRGRSSRLTVGASPKALTPAVVALSAAFVTLALIPRVAHWPSPALRRGEMLEGSGVRPGGVILAVVLALSALIRARLRSCR